MTSLLTRFAAHVDAAPYAPALVDMNRRVISRHHLLAAACRIAAQLHALGVRSGSVVALRATVCDPVWHAVDLAALMCGAVPAALPERATNADIAAALRVLNPACVIDRDPSLTLVAAGRAVGVPVLDPAGFGSSACHRLDEHLRAARSASGTSGACVIATSGSTGVPRFVLISQAGLIAGLDTWRRAWPGPARAATRTVSYLPISHIAQRIMGHHLLCLFGVAVHLATPDTLVQAIRHARPHILLGVPHTLADLLHAATADTTLRVALRTVSLLVNGAAALPPATADGLRRLGLNPTSAYGLTETTVPAFHTTGDDSDGLLGAPVGPVRARTSPTGELLLGTPYAAPYAARYVTRWPRTTATTDTDGWLHTGDRVTASAQGLRLAGRIAATIKTARGQLIAPEPVEAHLCARPDIAAACLIGHDRPHTVALVSAPTAAQWPADRRADTEAALRQGLRAAHHAGALPWADVHAVLIVTDDWQADPTLLTRTGKPRRRQIEARYTAVLDAHYRRQEVTDARA
ncbi:AMP-binding protein [Micromonospora sp. CA-263727]|uniref:AMP-binding protein n=1 Tax=Micromonospora sp. CA-263727 TaxID=3239967 RepID=UPI003D9013DF